MDDIESVLEQHCKDTVTFYGTRNSSEASEMDKENVNSSDSEVYTHALLIDTVNTTDDFLGTIVVCVNKFFRPPPIHLDQE